MDPVRDVAQLVRPDVTTPGLARHFGVVTAVVVGPPKTVTVQVSGSSTATAGIRYLASYTPTVNDVVLLLRAGPDFVAIHKLA